MILTRSGVAKDLKRSPFRIILNGVTYCFSSDKHLQKFKAQCYAYRAQVNLSLSHRFDYELDLSMIADLVLYRKIETRGFFIKYRGEEFTCQKLHVSSGDNLTLTSSKS